jgi:N,N-dimethylformamidase
MANLLSWAFLVGMAVAILAITQWYQLFFRRRWVVSVRLPDPVAYSDTPSFRSDQEIVIRIHSSKPVRVYFSRCGAGNFKDVHDVDADASPQSSRMHRWRGFDWKPSVTLAANTLNPGFYRISIEHQDDASHKWWMPLIVADPVPKEVVVVASTNTWNAYNDFGGLSNYKDRATPYPLKAVRFVLKFLNVNIRVGDSHRFLAVPLPESRPNGPIHRDLLDRTSGPRYSARDEAALIHFLERDHIAHTIISDREFAYNLGGSGIKLIIFNTHSEYWSEEMLGRLDEFIRRGISVLFLSGNNMYRKIQFLERAIFVTDMMTPSEQVIPLIGTYYHSAGYRTYDVYRVTDPTHWCFEGLPVQEGTEFGHGSANRRAASGHETDKIRYGGAGFQVVAVGKNAEGPAFMVSRDTDYGSFIFTVGSVSFVPCLEDDPIVQQLVRNLLRRALKVRC